MTGVGAEWPGAGDPGGGDSGLEEVGNARSAAADPAGTEEAFVGVPEGDSPNEGQIGYDSGGAGMDGAAETDEQAGPAGGDEQAGLAGEAEAIALRAERDEYLDALRRLQADFENYRKRMVRQAEEQSSRAAEDLVGKLLPVLDVADLALTHGGGKEVEQVWTALVEALGREGLERIDPDGGPFDPNLHDAVAHEPGEGGTQEVAATLRAGYAWKGRVLRPAMVNVRG